MPIRTLMTAAVSLALITTPPAAGGQTPPAAAAGDQAAPGAPATADRYPGETWLRYATPADAGWSAEGLAAALAYAESVGSEIGLLVHDGVVVTSWGPLDSHAYTASVHKALQGALVGLAVDRGELALDDTLGELGLADEVPLLPAERTARVRDLLTMRSGVFLPAANEDYSWQKPERGSRLPGTTFFYHEWDPSALNAIYERATGRSFQEAFTEELARPLGLEDFDPGHVTYQASPLQSSLPRVRVRLSARDMARIGLLYLREGRWGERQLLPAEWVRESTARHVDVGPNSMGYYIWIPGQPELAERGAYTLAGAGNVITVVPADDVVFVHRVGSLADRTQGEEIREILLRLLAARTGPAAAEPELVGLDEPIRVGATMSETGPLATQGVAAANGYRLCEAHVNQGGGLFGRTVEILIHDDGSDAAAAAALYERLIVEDRVDALLGPYGSTHTEAVAPVTERHRQVLISPLAATSSIWEQGRRYLFMVLPPAELFLAGLIDMASARGLESVAVLQEDALFPRAAGDGAVERARERGLDVVLHETYARGTTDFAPLLERVGAHGAHVLAMAASTLDDFVVVVRQMREHDVDVRMFGTSGAVAEFHEALGDDSEYAYGLSAWEPGLPYAGIDEFVDAYRRTFGTTPSFHAAGAYAGCQLFMEAARRAGSLDADALREELLDLETRTIFGDFAVDDRGYQTAHRGVFVQWQDGEKVVVWPDDVATGRPHFPTPPWSER